MRRLAIALIKGYQYAISPMLGANCRFHPTCSSYAEEAFRRFGVFKRGLSYASENSKMPAFPFRGL